MRKIKRIEALPPPRGDRTALRVVYSADRRALGRAIELDGRTINFGSEVHGPGHILDDTISALHARIRPAELELVYLCEDLGSENGVFVDGRRVHGSQRLAPGATIALGDTLLVVDREPEPDALPGSDHLGAPALQELGYSYFSAQLSRSLAHVARARGAVMLLGETGTGKEVAANILRKLAPEKNLPWVPVNCSAIPSDMAEAELFGYRRGAFTHALQDHDGYFARADGGVIFLDEVGDLPSSVQPKLLRALEEGTIQRLGDREPRSIGVRVIAATNAAVENGAMRRDLLVRMSQWVVRLAPLRERRADVLALFDHFWSKATDHAARYSPRFAEALLLFSWPGNIRELRNLAMRLAQCSETKELGLNDLPRELQRVLRDARSGAPAKIEEPPPTGKRPTREKLISLLDEADGNITAVAVANKWHRTQVKRWLTRYAIETKRRAQASPRTERPAWMANTSSAVVMPLESR